MGKLAGKEVKIGLAVISSLLIVFAFVLYTKVMRKVQIPMAAMAGDVEIAAPEDRGPASPEPTILPLQSPSNEEEEPAARGRRRPRTSASAQAAVDERDLVAPQASFMPNANEPPDDRYANREREAQAEAYNRSRRDDSSSQRDPFGAPGGEAAAAPEEPLTPAADPELSASPDGNDRRDEQQQSSNAQRAAASRAGATLPTTATTPHDERPRNHDFYTGRSPAPSKARAIDGETETREAEQPWTTPAERKQPGLAEDLALETSRQPRSAVALTPVPSAGKNGTYTVQPNDNYWVISWKVYGVGGYFKAIHQHNKGKFPHADKLQVGDKLSVPSIEELEQNYSDLCPKRRHVRAATNMTVKASARQRIGGKIYVVQEGDTLFDIARYQLGRASRWAEIYELNRDSLGEDFDFLQPGTELTLPASHDEEDSLTRRRSTTR